MSFFIGLKSAWTGEMVHVPARNVCSVEPFPGSSPKMAKTRIFVESGQWPRCIDVEEEPMKVAHWIGQAVEKYEIQVKAESERICKLRSRQDVRMGWTAGDEQSDE